MPTTVRLPEDIEDRIDFLSEATNRPKAFYLREMIINSLPEMEETYLAQALLEKVRSGQSKTISLEELEKELNI
ncbi:TPA: CopG family transcriptional regulator [Vibrio parahaemolyticus]